MGTEVLRPQDCLIHRIRSPPASFNHGRRAYGGSLGQNFYSNNRFNRKTAVRSDRSELKRRSQPEQATTVSKRSSSAGELRRQTAWSSNHGNTNTSCRSKLDLAMENVTILRRGQSFDSQIKNCEMVSNDGGDGTAVTGIGRLGPDPEKVPKFIADLMSPIVGKVDTYAGSAFAMSPSPSDLPFPSFSKKKQLTVDDSATRDLRRLLRLD